MMPKDILFTFIVPVFNSEKHIEKCIKSITVQTDTNWELIVINDGSTDNSLKILSNLLGDYKNSKIIDQKNQGAGYARNKGIQEASGDYIIFVDSDDYIEENYLRKLNSTIEKTFFDLIFIDVIQETPTGKILKNENLSKYNKKSKKTILSYQMTSKIPWGGVRKVVRTKVLRENNIQFNTITVGEEAEYSFRVLYHSKSFAFLKGPVYHYVNHEYSLSKQGGLCPYKPVLNRYDLMLNELNIQKQYELSRNTFEYVSLCVSLKRITEQFEKKDAILKMNQLFDSYPFNRVRFRSLKLKFVILYPLVYFKLSNILYKTLK